MAEQRKQGDQTPPATVETTTAARLDAAPAPSSGAKKKVAVAWPTDRFVVEGLPVVDRSGVSVTAEQYKTLEDAAKRSGVKLREVND